VTRRARTAILISGRGSNMAAVLEAAAAPEYPAEIVLVLSNRADAAGPAARAEAGVPTAPLKAAPSAATARPSNRRWRRSCSPRGVELVALAGFMRVLTEGFVARWRDRLVNIHPSLLPSFKAWTPMPARWPPG
jgi:phosphoribosylglycinamide formyltransferase-1